MPSVRGVYNARPSDGLPGIWVEPDWRDDRTVIGFSDAQIATFIAGLTGTAAQKRAQIKAKLESLRATLDATRDGNGFLVTSGSVQVTVTVTSLSPLLYELEVS